MIVRLYEGGGGGRLLDLAQDLGVQRRRAHLVVDLALPVLPVLAPALYRVVDGDLESDGLSLGETNKQTAGRAYKQTE